MINGRLEKVTPAKAKRWLATTAGVNFRKMSGPYARKLAIIMERGQWDRQSLAPIIFDTDGNLIDGQHRLAAIVLSGLTLQMFVIRGMQSDIGLDMGKRRSPADLVRKYCEVDSPTRVAPLAIRLLNCMRLGYDLAHRGGGSLYANGAGMHELIDLINAHTEEFNTAVKVQSSTNNFTAIAQFPLIRLLGIPSFDEKAQRFCEQVRDAHDVPKGSPVIALRDAMTRLIGQNSGGSAKTWERAALYGIAWEKYVTGSRAKRIRIPDKKRLMDPPGLQDWRDITGVELERTDQEETDEAANRPRAKKSDSAAAKRGKGRAGAVDSGRRRSRASGDLEGPRANP